MSIASSAAPTTPVSTPSRRTSAGRYPAHKCEEDDLSSVSSELGDSVLLASPSSACKPTRKSLLRPIKDLRLPLQPRRLVTVSLRPKKTLAALLERCYGNADVSDCIGRTLSFLLVVQLVISFLVATLLDE